MCVFFLLVLLVGIASAKECPHNVTVDISNGSFISHNESYVHQGLVYGPDNYDKLGELVYGCICEVKTCVRACCEQGYARINRVCVPHHTNVSIDVYDGTVLLEKNANYHHVVVEHKSICWQPGEKFYMQANGTLHFPKDNDESEYCISFFSAEDDKIDFIQCVSNTEDDGEPEVQNIIGMIISIPFLALTLIVYLILPDKNIHRLCQMAYVFTLMCAYSFLVYIQIKAKSIIEACDVVASLCYLSFLSAFFWMNISCMDIYWTFSGNRGFGHSRKSVQIRRFLIYCSYAFGVPTLFLCLIFILNRGEDTSSWYHPNFAIGNCWLDTETALLLYFYGPMGLLLLLNIIFFALTAWKIRQINQDTTVLRREDSRTHFESGKQRFNLYLKLLLAMGINWSFEFIPYLVKYLLGSEIRPEIWYATDFFNALYGVFIFFLFICKKTTWVMLQKRYFIFMGQPQKARALSTRTPHFQMSRTEKSNLFESTVTG